MTERLVWDDFDVALDFERVRKRLALEDEDDIALMRPLVDTARTIARPKAVVRVCYVDGIDGDEVMMDGIRFESRVLAKNLAGVHRVFAHVVTCGAEVDEWSHQEPDVIVSLWLDMVKEMILHEARPQMLARIKKRWGLEKHSSMNPGSGNADVWPISQQRPLFQMIGGVGEDAGVTLTDSMLMLPTKSSSGILFPSAGTWVNCALCSRENCPGRAAELDTALMAELQGAG